MIILKRKSLAVVFLSTSLIAIVLVMTLVGVYIYYTWHFEQDNISYQKNIAQLNADLFGKEILIKNAHITAVPWENEQIPVIKGQIVNDSKKRIKDIAIKVMFIDMSGQVLYVNIFHPVMQVNNIFNFNENTTFILGPKDSVSFEYKLFNVPVEIKQKLIDESNFSKDKIKNFDVCFEIMEIVLG
ncbi:MAG: hypothetical protein PHQ52_04195 [Candidatus Omnitrophica bacterium]|nr:hypothetical protein [Candidatus Omnitrophota bacterium]